MASLTVAAGLLAPKQVGDHSAAVKPFVGLRPKATNIPGQQQGQSGFSASNGARFYCMQTVNPLTNARFETMSYLPPLSPDSIAKEIDYMLSNGWIPCLEFDQKGAVFRDNSNLPGYYDGRYWTLWKLPMFGCNDPAPVLREIDECKAAYPNAFIRVLGFNNIKQGQCMSFIVQKPSSS